MSDIAIRVENLGKRYQIGELLTYRDLPRTIARAVTTPFRYLTGRNGYDRSENNGRCSETADRQGSRNSEFESNKTEFVWALKDVSFEVKRGEVLGIIGPNGAGKSTLLKLLSRITAPTEGGAEIYGRVASLLEVGTGFHPELTGRENVYLNGSILGMRKAEIDAKFDEIVEFSGVEKFIDTPVKRYSSGMHVRLGFAVAAHLEPEILIVDEVLAVGDASFQSKCQSKMAELARRGQVLLFVSHNMQAIRRLCERALWIDNGRVHLDGPCEQLSIQYLRKSTNWVADGRSLRAVVCSAATDPVLTLNDIVLIQYGEPTTTIVNGSPLQVHFDYNLNQSVMGFRIFFDLCDLDESILIRSFHDDDSSSVTVTYAGRYISVAELPANLLAPISYNITFRAGIYKDRSLLPGGITVPITVRATGRVNRAYPEDVVRSKVQPHLHWKTTKILDDKR